MMNGRKIATIFLCTCVLDLIDFIDFKVTSSVNSAKENESSLLHKSPSLWC